MLNLHAMMKSSKLGEPARLLVVCALILGCFGTPLEASAQTETETTAQCQLSLTALMDRKIAEQAAKGEDGDKHRLILERAKLRFVEGCNANDKIIANNLAKSASNEQRRAAFCSATFEEKWFGKTRWLKKSQEIDEKKLSYADATTLLASLSNFSNQFLAARSRICQLATAPNWEKDPQINDLFVKSHVFLLSWLRKTDIELVAVKKVIDETCSNIKTSGLDLKCDKIREDLDLALTSGKQSTEQLLLFPANVDTVQATAFFLADVHYIVNDAQWDIRIAENKKSIAENKKSTALIVDIGRIAKKITAGTHSTDDVQRLAMLKKELETGPQAAESVEIIMLAGGILRRLGLDSR